MRAVAEGVEDSAILSRLGELGCDVAQGYHVSRPLPAESFERWMAGYPSRALWLAEAEPAVSAA